MCNSYLGRQTSLLQTPLQIFHLFSGFLLLSFLSMTPYSIGHPFGQAVSAVLTVSPHRSCCTPSLLAVRAKWDREKALTYCASTAQQQLKHQSVISTFCHKSKTQHHTMKKINSIPATMVNSTMVNSDILITFQNLFVNCETCCRMCIHYIVCINFQKKTNFVNFL